MTTWTASRFHDLRQELGPQRQSLLPAIATGRHPISSGWVVMPDGHMAAPHIHRDSDIIVAVISGHVVSLLGEHLTPEFHGPGDSIHIPAGVLHAGVNLNTAQRAVLLECRTDPHFNRDVIPIPGFENMLQFQGRRHQEAFILSGERSVLELL
jgi:uncharacterized RmlC-like cupin family protein